MYEFINEKSKKIGCYNEKMKKTSEEIMNGCGKEFNEDEVCGCYIKWGNKVHLCPTCQAQKQERLDCYKKFIDELGTLWAKGYGTAYDMPREFLEKLIKFYEKEIKILEGK